MKFYLSCIAGLIWTVVLCGQQKGPHISFEKESYSFGKIEEAKGPVSYTFSFTNTGSEPLVLQSVLPSCGCTTPEWSRKPVEPGGKGFIKATFNPAGRKGPFDKSIKINSNNIGGVVSLRFNGEVIGKALSIEDQFPFKIDNLRFSSLYISYGKISPGKSITRTLQVINTGNENVALSFPAVPPHIEVMVNPSTLKPNQKGTIDFSYDATRKNDWGPLSDMVNYTVNGKADSRFRINLTATITDDYTGASPAQLANAPVLKVDKGNFEFGTITAGEKIEIKFLLKNNGKSNLLIHKINSECGCTAVKIKDKLVKPGASTEITGQFDSTGQRGMINKAVTIMNNDPQNPNLVLWIRGTVN